MSMTILLPVATFPDQTSKVGLGCALNLAARFGGEVTALVQEVDIAPVRGFVAEALGYPRMAAEAELLSHQRAAHMLSWAKDRAGHLELALEARVERHRPEELVDVLIAYARTHDLTAQVLDLDDAERLADTEAIVFGSGGPVLIVPASDTTPIPVEKPAAPLKVVVAWDGSRSASRAIRDALPILVRSDGVSIATVADDKAIEPGGIAMLQSYLDHHGVRSRLLPRTRGTSSIGDVLQAVALEEGADLLVLGAYGHNRLQEMVLGGATRTILRRPRLPVLLSH